MAKVAREMVEKAGVDVDKLVDLLVRNASAELTTYYYYTILRVNLIGLEGEGIKAIAEDARIEDRNHFEALVPRIYELGWKLKCGFYATRFQRVERVVRRPRREAVRGVEDPIVVAEVEGRCGEHARHDTRLQAGISILDVPA